MKEFWTYLRARRRVFLCGALCVLIFTASFYLYGLPLRAVWYPAALCAALGAVFCALDHLRVRKKCRLLTLPQNADAALPAELPPAGTPEEARYQALLEQLRRQFADERTAAQARYSQMIDYYTVWAHQIKTPIAAMRLTLQCEDQPLARSISSELLRIEQYVQMAMTYLRLDSDETDYAFRTQPLDPIIRQAVRRFSGEFILRKLRLEYEPVDRTVVTDEKWLTFVLEQLLSNALKYTRAGSIRIFLRDERTLCVADTGIGIAKDDLPRIFEKGFTGATGRAEQSASGLGLYLCRRVCKALNIAIRAESTLGAGTTVFLTLPDAPGRAE